MNSAQELKVYAKFQKILYVEDDESLRVETVNILKRFYMVVKSAANGQEALELYKKEKFDVVLTDIRMPKMDGIELARLIKEQNKKQNIIVMSAHDETEYFIELIKVGINEFILKPADTDQFLYALLQASEEVECLKELEKLQYKAIMNEISSSKTKEDKKCNSRLSSIAKSKVDKSENLQKVISNINSGIDDTTVSNMTKAISELSTLNDELEEALGYIFSDEAPISKSDLEHFISIFKDYEMILKEFDDFGSIADTILEVENIIAKVDVENMEHIEALGFLNSIYEDFIRFINLVFIEQTSTDVAYFDDCIRASIHELEIKLGLKEGADYIEIF
jgi:YesN/AraC family two-component response regulator